MLSDIIACTCNTPPNGCTSLHWGPYSSSPDDGSADGKLCRPCGGTTSDEFGQMFRQSTYNGGAPAGYRPSPFGGLYLLQTPWNHEGDRWEARKGAGGDRAPRPPHTDTCIPIYPWLDRRVAIVLRIRPPLFRRFNCSSDDIPFLFIDRETGTYIDVFQVHIPRLAAA